MPDTEAEGDEAPSEDHAEDEAGDDGDENPLLDLLRELSPYLQTPLVVLAAGGHAWGTAEDGCHVHAHILMAEAGSKEVREVEIKR